MSLYEGYASPTSGSAQIVPVLEDRILESESAKEELKLTFAEWVKVDWTA